VRGATRDIGALGMDRLDARSGVRVRRARGGSDRGVATRHSRLVFRSDHFPFARSGVPALSIKPGVDFVGRPAGWGQEQENIYNEQRYHQPSDEYRPAFRYAGWRSRCG